MNVASLARALGSGSRPAGPEALQGRAGAALRQAGAAGAEAEGTGVKGTGPSGAGASGSPLPLEVLLASCSGSDVVSRMNGKELVELAWGLAATSQSDGPVPCPPEKEPKYTSNKEDRKAEKARFMGKVKEPAKEVVEQEVPAGGVEASAEQRAAVRSLMDAIAARFMKGPGLTAAYDDDGGPRAPAPGQPAQPSPSANLRALTPAYLSRLAWAVAASGAASPAGSSGGQLGADGDAPAAGSEGGKGARRRRRKGGGSTDGGAVQPSPVPPHAGEGPALSVPCTRLMEKLGR